MLSQQEQDDLYGGGPSGTFWPVCVYTTVFQAMQEAMSGGRATVACLPEHAEQVRRVALECAHRFFLDGAPVKDGVPVLAPGAPRIVETILGYQIDAGPTPERYALESGGIVEINPVGDMDQVEELCASGLYSHVLLDHRFERSVGREPVSAYEKIYRFIPGALS